jgi:hypothetical protein
VLLRLVGVHDLDEKNEYDLFVDAVVLLEPR